MKLSAELSSRTNSLLQRRELGDPPRSVSSNLLVLRSLRLLFLLKGHDTRNRPQLLLNKLLQPWPPAVLAYGPLRN
jgi:hypothetical protein